MADLNLEAVVKLLVTAIKVNFDRHDHIDQHNIDRTTMNRIVNREQDHKGFACDKVKQVVNAINERKETNDGEQEEQQTEEAEQKDGEENVEVEENEKEASESCDVAF